MTAVAFTLPDTWLLAFGNAAAASLLIGVMTLCAFRLARRRTAPVQHGLLLAGLLLLLAAPLVVGASNVADLGLVQVVLERPAGDEIGSAAPVATIGVPDAASVRDTIEVTIIDDMSPSYRDVVDELRIQDAAGADAAARDRELGDESPTALSVDVGATDRAPGASASAVSIDPGRARADLAVAADAPQTGNDSRSLHDSWRSAASIVCFVWMFGALAALVRLWIDLRAVRRLRRESIPADEDLLSTCRSMAARLNLRRLPAVCLSIAVPVPMTAGCRRPTVLLPAQVPNRLDADALQAVLLHELAHIARRDLWIGLLQRLCTAIYWWNPLVRGLNRRLSDVRENVCDNYVLAHVRDRRRYARVLLDLAARVTAPPPPPPLPATVGLVAEPFTGLSARITGLLNEERNMETRMSRCSTACLTLFALLIGVGIGALAVRSELRAPLVDGPGMTEPGPVGGTTLPGDPSRSYDALPVSMVVDTGMNSLPMPNVVGPPAAVPATTVEMPAPVEFARSPADAPPVIALPDSSAFASAAPEIAPADAFIPASEPPPAPTPSLPASFDLPPQATLAPLTDLNPFAGPPDTRPAESEPFASSRDTPPTSLPAGGQVAREPFRELPVPVAATGTAEPTQPRPNDIILLTLRASDDGSLEELLYFTTPLGNGDEAFKKLEERFAEKSAERADPLLPNLELQITVDPQLRHEHVARVLDVGGRRIARVTFPQAGKSFDADLVLSVGFVRHRSGQPLSDTPVVFWRDQVHGVGDLQRLLYDEYRRIETAREREGRPARDGAITVLLQVDEAVGYDAVNSIIKQAQSAGFRKFILKVLSAKDALPADEAPPNVPQSRVVPADGTGDAPTTQVRFIGPAGMQVNWTPHDSLLSGPVTVPERIDVTRDGTLPLRFTDIPGRDGLIVDGELELRAVGQAVSTFLNRNAVPMEITDEDLDQVVAGNHVIKVVYVPDGKQGESGSSGIEVLVSTRLEAGVDPLDVAHHRGTILAVLWLGDRKRSP